MKKQRSCVWNNDLRSLGWWCGHGCCTSSARHAASGPAPVCSRALCCAAHMSCVLLSAHMRYETGICFVYVYVYVYIYIYSCQHMSLRVMSVPIYMRVLKKNIYIYTHTHIHTYIYIYIYIYIYTHTHIYIYIYIYNIRRPLLKGV